MDRAKAWSRLDGDFDVLVIGGGATGLSVALDSASRGYRTALVEGRDFAQGTSSRSTKLLHGGVRYLRQGNVKLVREALHERDLLVRNAPHLASELRFLVPSYRWWERPYYATGLRMYDVLAGRSPMAKTQVVGASEAAVRVPTIARSGLRGGILYSDGQFDDARMAVCLARTAEQQGAILVNYATVTALVKEAGRTRGVIVRDEESGAVRAVRARSVINATGVFVDAIRRMDEPDSAPIVAVSQGIHLVLPRDFLPGDTAVMVPRTRDGRVIFMIPWQGRALIGTTDTGLPGPEAEPRALEEEIAFVLEHAAMYLERAPRREDILSVFAGLRPLVRGGTANTAALSRDHTLLVSPSGLVTICGGKWTTCRRMAQDTVDRAARVADLPEKPCPTETLPLHGADALGSPWAEFGASADEGREWERRYPGVIHPNLPYTMGQAAFVIANEMVVRLEDVLSRRLRALLLDARAAVEAAPGVAGLMACLQEHDAAWVEREVESFRRLANRYLPA